MPFEPPSGPPLGGWTLHVPPTRRAFAARYVAAPAAPAAPAPPDEELEPEPFSQDLVNHAKTAMYIELTTIPLYLYAAYSIPPDSKSAAALDARRSIMGVVREEMLHLALSGNIMRALNSEQYLYDDDFIPKYTDRTHILYDRIDVNLRQATKEELGTFVKIEKPWVPIKAAPGAPYEDSGDIAPEYHSIGQFYEEFLHGLEKASESYAPVLDHNAEYQFNNKEAFPTYMEIITAYPAAKKAIDLIIAQGEGGAPEQKTENSHYKIFTRLYNEKETWECYPVPKNPTTEGFSQNKYAYHLSLAFDAMFCYLLQSIDRIWHTSRETEPDLRQYVVSKLLFGIMGSKKNPHSIMNQLAGVLVQTPLGDGKGNAAPTFNFYPRGGSPLSPENLWNAIQKELKLALDTPQAQTDPRRQDVEQVLQDVILKPPFPILTA